MCMYYVYSVCMHVCYRAEIIFLIFPMEIFKVFSIGSKVCTLNYAPAKANYLVENGAFESLDVPVAQVVVADKQGPAGYIRD